MKIILEKIRFKNILSVGNSFQEICLNEHPITMITGENGNGKSLIISAITFALFGRAYRKINKPQLVNSINNENLITEIFFKIGKKQYKIIRGIKPAIFKIFIDNSEKMLNQDAKIGDYQKYLEESILKCTYKTFTQIVILGSANFVPFMQLSLNDRRMIVEDILDIEIFSKMKKISKENFSIIKGNIETVDQKINLIKEKITIYDNVEKELLENKKENIHNKEKEVVKYKKEINCFTCEIAINKDMIEKIQEKLCDYSEITKRIDQLNRLKIQISQNEKNNIKDSIFYTKNSCCPTCLQDIVSTFRDNKLKIIEEKKIRFRDGLIMLGIELEKNEKFILKSDQLNDDIEQIRKKYEKQQELTISNNLKIEELEEEISKLNNENKKENYKEKRETELVELEKISKDRAEYLQEKENYSIVNLLLNDGGIKTKIINKYIPIINSKINAFLNEMSFYCSFNFDNEFNEIIKSRYRDNFSYESFSEGEKKRIDLSLLLTWREISSLKNSIDINILFLDEIFDSSLDQFGIDDVIKVFCVLKNTNIFVISHRGDILEDKICNKIVVRKKLNFTEITQE